MSVTAQRYREIGRYHFRRVLLAWLAKLPSGGWEGTVYALEAELVRVARHAPVPPFIPRRNGLGKRIAAEVPFLEASGFQAVFRRTKSERTLRFTPA